MDAEVANSHNLVTPDIENMIIHGGHQSLWWSQPGNVTCDTSAHHKCWNIVISWVLNGFPLFFLYNGHNLLYSNKFKAQINVYLSSKIPKTWKYDTNCSFSPHLSNHHHYPCLGTPLHHLQCHYHCCYPPQSSIYHSNINQQLLRGPPSSYQQLWVRHDQQGLVLHSKLEKLQLVSKRNSLKLHDFLFVKEQFQTCQLLCLISCSLATFLLLCCLFCLANITELNNLFLPLFFLSLRLTGKHV